MATEIVIPTVGESVTSGVIAAWSVAEGEWVERDETVLELETDKITMEVPAPASGVVKHAAAEGDTVDVGAVVGTIDESAEKPSGGSGEASASSSAEAEGTGSSDGKTAAPAATKDKQEPAEQPAASANGSPSSKKGASSGDKPAGITDDDVRATPLARKLAEQNGISLRTVTGTGAGGKIREHDVLALMQGGGQAASEPAAGGGVSRSSTVEPMSPLRQRIATRLVQAQQTAAMLTTFNEVDMGPVMDLRKQHKEAFAEKHGIGLGFMSFFTKAAASALRAFPMVNAYIVEGQGGKPAVQKHDYCDIAIAVSSPKGLVVPVLRNVEGMSFADVESTIKDYAVRAKDGKLGLEEMQGGTFTITNGGIFGSLMSTPILNPPQSAILGMHTIKGRPMEYPVKSGQMAIRPMMYLALSYDHRIVDGAEAVQFLVHIKDAIEDPTRLLLEL